MGGGAADGPLEETLAVVSTSTCGKKPVPPGTCDSAAALFSAIFAVACDIREFLVNVPDFLVFCDNDRGHIRTRHHDPTIFSVFGACEFCSCPQICDF